MSHTGTYVYAPGQGLVKVSEAMPRLARPVYFNKGGVASYDASARTTFESKAQKRQWLQTHGLREGGIIHPDSRVDMGSVKNRGALSATARAAQARRQATIASEGGTLKLVERIQSGKGHFL